MRWKYFWLERAPESDKLRAVMFITSDVGMPRDAIRYGIGIGLLLISTRLVELLFSKQTMGSMRLTRWRDER